MCVMKKVYKGVFKSERSGQRPVQFEETLVIVRCRWYSASRSLCERC